MVRRRGKANRTGPATAKRKNVVARVLRAADLVEASEQLMDAWRPPSPADRRRSWEENESGRMLAEAQNRARADAHLPPALDHFKAASRKRACRERLRSTGAGKDFPSSAPGCGSYRDSGIKDDSTSKHLSKESATKGFDLFERALFPLRANYKIHKY